MQAMAKATRLVSTTDGLLVLANLATRGFGFLVSLVLARTAGIGVLGAYSSLQISSSAPITPLSLPLANTATLMATEHTAEHGLRAIGVAHRWIIGLFALVGAGGGCALLLLASSEAAAQDKQVMPLATGLVAVALLAASQLLTQFSVGLYHGAQRGRDCAQAIGVTMVVATLLCIPVVITWGIEGALTLAVMAAASPGMWLTWRLRTLPRPAHDISPAHQQALRHEAALRIRQALPSVISTIIRNGTSWFCCIYLAGRFHGPEGVGLVTIGLQWMMLMQLPISSWGGRIVSDLGAAHDRGPEDFNAALRQWFGKCMLVATVSSVAVAVAFPVLAQLYKVDAWHMTMLMAINAVASILAAATYVYERAAFCLKRQRAWLWLSGAADVCQIVFTLALAPQALLFIVAGPIVSAALLMVSARVFVLQRTGPSHPVTP